MFNYYYLRFYSFTMDAITKSHKVGTTNIATDWVA